MSSSSTSRPPGARHGPRPVSAQRKRVEDALRAKWIVCQPLWAVDRLVDVRDHAITPASDLVPQHRAAIASSGYRLRLLRRRRAAPHLQQG